MDIVRRKVKRVGIAIVGGTVLLVGIIAIPYPGPGWLIVFAGLAILATEFEWARRLLRLARREYGKWQTWLKEQNTVVRLLLLVATGMVVIFTMWIFDVFGVIDQLLHLHITWAHSPLGIFG